MKKTLKTRIAAGIMTLIMGVAFSATAFADGPQGGPRQGNGQMEQPMGGPQNGTGMGTPQNEAGQNGQLPPEKPEGDERMPMDRGDMDPMNRILTAVNELEDEDVKANIESLLDALQDAIEAEQNAEDDDARAEAAEAVAAAREALDTALAAAGIEIDMGAPEGGELPGKPEGNEPPADGQQPPEKPEGGEDMTPPEMSEEGNAQDLPSDQHGMFRLFQQFLEWLKGSSEA